MAIAAGKSGSEKTPAEELSKEETTLQLQHDSGPIGGMCRMRMIIILDLVECNNKEGPGTINISSREENPEPWAYL